MSHVHSLLSLTGAAPTQENRLIELHTVLGTDVLVAERAEIDEGIAPHPAALPDSGGRDEAPATGCRIVVHALSVDAHLELKQLIGQPALVELLTSHSRGVLRPWHGHITRAALIGSDGGLARYRLVIEPWLSFLGHRQDSWVFQDQTVREIVEEVFADYQAQGRLAPAWRWDVADDSVYPRRSLCTQYRESDLAFVQRLLREEGLFHWFEHTGAAQDPALGAHTLVIADHNGAFTTNAQAVVRYTQSSAALEEDSLVRWQRKARLQTSAVQLASPDYRTLALREAAQTGVAAVLPELRLDDVPGAYAHEDAAQAERLALRQMQAIDALRDRVQARGSVRTAAPGTVFTLCDHPVHDGRDEARDRFVMLRVRLRARNNLHADVRAAVGQAVDAPVAPTERPGMCNDSAEPVYACELVAQPAAVPVRSMLLDDAGKPDPRLHPRPAVHGVQTAVVVGLGEPVHTDRDHRIKLQFHWQRGRQGSHRLDAPRGDNAPGNDAAGTWVRVAESVAGANWGSHFVPRLGHEVLVSFIGGDIDRPVVIGSLYNGAGQTDAPGNAVPGGPSGATGNANAWFPGEQAQGALQAHRHAAVLAGFKTQELCGSQGGTGGYNQLVFDDTPAANRIELSTTQVRSRLQLGHLLNQSDNQRLQPRGHGIDLATAAWGAVRAGSGLLLSAHGRSGSRSSGHQIDSLEPQVVLEEAKALMAALLESGHEHDARLGDEGESTPPSLRGLQTTLRSLTVATGSEVQELAYRGSSTAVVHRSFPSKPDPVESGVKTGDDENGNDPVPGQLDGTGSAVSTGLGGEVDALASMSPTLQSAIAALKAKKWSFKYGPAGEGSYADANAVPPIIVIDSAEQGNVPKSVQTLAHEVGHALYQYVPDLSSREAYVDGALADEGAATLTNIAVMREIESITGQDIGIAGNSSNHPAYEAAYDKFLHDGDVAAARAGIGKIFGSKEYASVPVDGKSVNYEQYYGGWYDTHFPAKK